MGSRTRRSARVLSSSPCRRPCAPSIRPSTTRRTGTPCGTQGTTMTFPVEFTRLFDVGTGAPPCPLHGGLYFGDRMKTMEEAVRFYNFFGLTLSESPRELPDHIVTQLEFLHFLAFREAQALDADGRSGTRGGARSATSSTRHPARWVPQLRKRLDEAEPDALLPGGRRQARGLPGGRGLSHRTRGRERLRGSPYHVSISASHFPMAIRHILQGLRVGLSVAVAPERYLALSASTSAG